MNMNLKGGQPKPSSYSIVKLWPRFQFLYIPYIWIKVDLSWGKISILEVHQKKKKN